MSRHRVPVLSPAQISQLPARHVVIIRRGMAPAVGKVQMAWKRSDVRAAQRATAWAHCTQAWATEWERLHHRLGEWIEATEVRGVPLAHRLGLTIPPRPLPTESTEVNRSEV